MNYENEKLLQMKKILTLALSLIISIGNGQNWDKLEKNTASDRAIDDWFGWSASISGNYAILGAYLKNDLGTVQMALIGQQQAPMSFL